MEELFAFPPKFITTNPTLDNFRKLFKASRTAGIPLSKYVFNSLLITVTVVFSSLIFSTAASYALSKLKFKGRELMMQINQFAIMFVPVAVMIPRYLVVNTLGMTNTYWSQILPLIPLPLIQQVISFFRSFMLEDEEYEALALIYWDKVERRFFAHVPKQNVRKEHIEADLRDCPYDDDSRYIRYADIHSHNSMDPFFSPEDNRDERGTGLYFVIGHLERFFPELKARISCEGSFVEIDPAEVIDWPASTFPDEWSKNVVCEKKSVSRRLSQRILEVSMLP